MDVVWPNQFNRFETGLSASVNGAYVILQSQTFTRKASFWVCETMNVVDGTN